MNKAATIPAPKGRAYQFFTNLALYDMIVALAALAAAGGAGYLAYQEVSPAKRSVGYLVFGAAVVVFLANVVKAGLQWKDRSEKQSTHELEGCLFTLHDILMGPLSKEAADETGFRVTIHAPKGDGGNLVQVVNYIGSQRKKNRMGQMTPIACGITGRAFRTKNETISIRADTVYENYLTDLVENQSYTKAQAEKLDRDSMAFCAIPIVDNQEVVGIVYADATDAAFFTPERTNLIRNGCVGIARFVGQKYKV